ncbi:hypothetical protein SI65_00045 [Aspergillus cristatus]|uniref:Uncharacterized protein n=1 Tax=Aspergillus cristatus TaxID=573508 RepID=A0A1E3BNI1_ASPCR|nr:hypothetical protein SI65_00045 [Aspergillus cristatus]
MSWRDQVHLGLSNEHEGAIVSGHRNLWDEIAVTRLKSPKSRSTFWDTKIVVMIWPTLSWKRPLAGMSLLSAFILLLYHQRYLLSSTHLVKVFFGMTPAASTVKYRTYLL